MQTRKGKKWFRKTLSKISVFGQKSFETILIHLQKLYATRVSEPFPNLVNIGESRQLPNGAIT